MTSFGCPHPSQPAPTPPPAWPYQVPPPTRPARRRPGIETRQILLTLGAVCLIVAFTAGTALVWSALRPGGQAAVMAVVTLGLLAGAVASRRLNATAEALAAVGLAGCVVDAIAARTLPLSFATGISVHWYVVCAAVGITAVAGVLGKLAPNLTSAPLAWSVAPLVAAVAAVNPTNHHGGALLAPIGIAVATGLDHALRQMPSPSRSARILNALDGALVAAVGFTVSVVALTHHDPVGVWGAALPLALFAFPVLAGNSRWVAEDSTAAMAGITAATLVMAAGATAGAGVRAGAAIALPVVAVYVLMIEGGSWIRRTQIALSSLGFTGLVAWRTVAAVDERFATVNFVLAGAAAGVAIAWPRSRRNTEAVRVAAIATMVVLATMASTITLHLHHVATIEAYLATPASLILVSAAAMLVRDRTLPSVVLLPGLMLAMTPTLFMGLRGDHGRQAILLVASAVLVVAGAEFRLATPLTLGSVAIGLLSLRLAGPQLAMLPKWELFAAVGAVLLTLGATWDARLADARRIRGRMRPKIAALR